MLFDFLKDILYRKKGDLFNNPDNEGEFSPYIIQRWISMRSNNNVKLLNETTNKLYPIYETKEDWYKSFLMLIPRTVFKKIKYIKKDKKDKEDNELEDERVRLIARNMQISQREVRMCLDEFDFEESAGK